MTRPARSSVRALTDQQVMRVLELARAGQVASEIAREFGLSKNSIRMILAGLSYRDVPGERPKLDKGPLVGERHHRATLTVEMILEANRRVEAGEAIRAVALDMGVGEVSLGAALRGKSYGLFPRRTRRTKLDADQAAEIRRLRAEEGLTGRAIAARFEVARSTIQDVIAGKIHKGQRPPSS